MPRTEERISKGRRAFHAITSLGVKKNGITMATCSKLFWSIIMPIVTYGSELWVMKGDEVEELRKFQRYVGRRCQRFPKRSSNHSAYASLGWLSIDRYIQVKKMLFIRSITILDDDDICKRLLMSRTNDFTEDMCKHRRNENDSPIFDLLDTSIKLGLYKECLQMILNGYYYSKVKWRKMVWEMAWDKEDDDCITMFKQPHQDFLLYNVTSHPYYLIWWIISDLMPNMIRMCECMASLVCETSRVKSDDYRLKGKSFSYKVCIKCELGVKESIHHIVMQCPLYDEERRNMYGELESLNDDTINQILEEPQNIFHTLMGKQPDNTPFEAMVNFWLITGKFISGMYARAISGRE